MSGAGTQAWGDQCPCLVWGQHGGRTVLGAGAVDAPLHTPQWTLHTCGDRWGLPQAQVVPRGTWGGGYHRVVSGDVSENEACPSLLPIPRLALCRKGLGSCKVDLGEPCLRSFSAPPSWEKAHPPQAGGQGLHNVPGSHVPPGLCMCCAICEDTTPLPYLCCRTLLSPLASALRVSCRAPHLLALVS